MKRKIYEDLLKWKNNDSYRTALLIDGQRRVVMCSNPLYYN